MEAENFFPKLKYLSKSLKLSPDDAKLSKDIPFWWISLTTSLQIQNINAAIWWSFCFYLNISAELKSRQSKKKILKSISGLFVFVGDQSDVRVTFIALRNGQIIFDSPSLITWWDSEANCLCNVTHCQHIYRSSPSNCSRQMEY